ncbi:hypothetical protein Tco_0968105 [Tanacetum coccineum]
MERFNIASSVRHPTYHESTTNQVKKCWKLMTDWQAIQAQLNNLGKEIKKVNEKVYDVQVGCEQWQRNPITPKIATKGRGGKP